MATPKDDLRKEIESTFRKVCDDLKNHKVRNAENREKAARYALREIRENLLPKTGLVGEPKKPLGDMNVTDFYEAVALWCLEKRLERLFPDDEG